MSESDQDEGRPCIRPGAMEGWADRKTGKGIENLDQYFSEGDADALIFYVDPESDTPIWAQLVWLWLRRHVFRRPL